MLIAEVDMNYKLVISLLLAAIVGVFIVQNAVAVEIYFLFWKFAMSRALVVLFVLLIGIVIGWLVRGHFIHAKTRAN